VDIDSDPIILEGVIYAATYQGQVAAVQLETGRILWTTDLSSYAGFAVDEDYLYISDQSSHIRAFDRFSGEQIWEQGRLNMRNVTAPARVGDYLVVGDVEGYLHWLDKRTGDFVARTRPADAPYIAPPLVVGNILYAFSSDGTLTASTFR
jgi:outer membrane protein assembly factor BamB